MENYQFIKQIGQGSYGEIWLVKCSRTRAKHVLKRIDLHQASKREQRAAHLEAKLLSTVKHPNIVTYLDSFYNSCGSLFIVMNYYECGDLYTFIKNQNGIYFEEKQIVHWFVQICLALKYLHDKNILHRNLKTRNIFLTKNKIIRVGDLGLSKVLSIAHEMTATLIETPYYIGPEIFAGESYNEKSDIWALGCCTYEMTTLKHPFIAADVHSLVKKIMKRKLPSIPDTYSSELFDIISSMLSMEPEDRPCITSLLLNDYIRRYILLILQDNSKSPDSLYSEKSSVLSSERSRSNSDLRLLVPKERLNNTERSVSTCFLPRDISKDSKCSGATAKKKTNCAKTLITSVPDVNGNGDGNDNSQHRRILNAKSSTNFSKKTSSVNGENSSQRFTKLESGAKKSKKHKVSTASNATSVLCNSTKIANSSNAANQKMRSTISFQILNNLAFLLHTSRQENFKDNNSNISCESSSFEPINLNSQLHYSSEDCFNEKYAVSHPKKIGKNDYSCNDVNPRADHRGKVFTLPRIKVDTQDKKESVHVNEAKNLPCMNNRDLFSSECDRKRNEPSFLKKSGNKMDNLLKKPTENSTFAGAS